MFEDDIKVALREGAKALHISVRYIQYHKFRHDRIVVQKITKSNPIGITILTENGS